MKRTSRASKGGPATPAGTPGADAATPGDGVGEKRALKKKLQQLYSCVAEHKVSREEGENVLLKLLYICE